MVFPYPQCPIINKEHVEVFFYQAFKQRASQDPDNRDIEQLGLVRLCGQCSVWHIPIIGITPVHLLKGMSKKRPPRAP